MVSRTHKAEPQKLLRQLRATGLNFTHPVDMNMFLFYIYQGIKVRVKTDRNT